MKGIHNFYIMDRISGICLYLVRYETISEEIEKRDPNLVGGFITTFLNFAKQAVGEDVDMMVSENLKIVYEFRGPLVYMLLVNAQNKYADIKGENIRGDMFDPLYYMSENPWDDWPKHRQKVLDWFKNENIKMVITYPQDTYEELAKREKDHFEFLRSEIAIMMFKVSL